MRKMRTKGIVIAIDGPGGSGKSSVGREVAFRIGYKFISTGKMYRALAWLCLQKGVNIDSEEEVLELIKANKIIFKDDGNVEFLIEVNGMIIERELYTETIASATSKVARLKQIREVFVAKQREIGILGGVVMEGRDITTNVFPDAELKIYLDASAIARARRRYEQLKANGIEANYDEILKMIITRDEQDKARNYNPLKIAKDSYYIDSTEMSKEDVVNLIVDLYRKLISRAG